MRLYFYRFASLLVVSILVPSLNVQENAIWQSDIGSRAISLEPYSDPIIIVRENNWAEY
jgi:hypothetical protein